MQGILHLLQVPGEPVNPEREIDGPGRADGDGIVVVRAIQAGTDGRLRHAFTVDLTRELEVRIHAAKNPERGNLGLVIL